MRNRTRKRSYHIKLQNINYSYIISYIFTSSCIPILNLKDIYLGLLKLKYEKLYKHNFR